MMKRWLPALALLGLAQACVDSSVMPTSPDPEPELTVSAAPPAQATRYIVVLRGGPPGGPSDAAAFARAQGLTPDFVYQRVFNGFAATMSEATAQALRGNPQVELVEADQIMTITGTQSPTPSWGLDRIDQRNLPLDNSYTFGPIGAGVTFYGIDTGIRASHSDFSGRMAPGFTSIGDGRGTDDCHGHGTHTASTAAGSTYGVAKGMTIVPVRVLGCNGSGPTSGVIAGVDWVAANARLPAVANMSLGGGASSALDQAVANSVAAGVVFAVSAGNSATSACTQSPAREPTALTTASTTSSDQRSSFSNYGSCVDLFAPGSSITAAWNTSNSASATLSGTSMAAPHVTGAAGLYLEANSGATPGQVAQALTSNATAGVVGNPGSGSPNLLLYTGFIGGGGPPPPPPPTNNPPIADYTWTCDASITCTFDGTSSTDDHGIVLYEWINAKNGKVVGTGPTWTRTFSKPRTIRLSLRVTDGGGLSDTVTKTIDVGPGGPSPPPPGGNNPPTASFTWSCPSLTCDFDASGSTDDQGIVLYEWINAANGKVAGTGVTWRKTFASSGTRSVMLRVTDGGGLSDSQTQQVVVP